MPQIQLLDYRTPAQRIAGGLGKGLGEGLLQQQQKQRETDVINRLSQNYQPGMSELDFLKQVQGEIPLDKAQNLFSNISENYQKKQKQALENQQFMNDYAFSQALIQNQLYGTPIPKGLGPKDPKDAIEYTKMLRKGGYTPEISSMLRDPKFINKPAGEQIADLVEAGMEDTRATATVAQINKGKEVSTLTPSQSFKITEKYRDKTSENAERSEKLLLSFDKALNLLDTNQVGPENMRNFIASFMPEDSAIRGLIETPENQEFRSVAYQSIIGTKNDFGARLTDRDVNLVLDKMITANKTAEVNRRIIQYQSMLATRDVMKKQIMNDVIRENGGIPPSDLDQQVSDRMKQTQAAKDFERKTYELKYMDDNGNFNKVLIRSPNGKVFAVSPDRVEQAIKEGGVRL